jgi:hypothetical protein
LHIECARLWKVIRYRQFEPGNRSGVPEVGHSLLSGQEFLRPHTFESFQAGLVFVHLEPWDAHKRVFFSIHIERRLGGMRGKERRATAQQNYGDEFPKQPFSPRMIRRLDGSGSIEPRTGRKRGPPAIGGPFQWFSLSRRGQERVILSNGYIISRISPRTGPDRVA